MPTVLVTGANRGIGLELGRQYAAAGWNVLATCRAPGRAAKLQELARAGTGSAFAGFEEGWANSGAAPRPTFKIEMLPLSVTDPEHIENLARDLDGRPLDLLLNNAGVRGDGAANLGSIDPGAFLHTIHVNTLGALKVTEALLPNLRRAEAPLVVMMSSSLGSLARNEEGGDYAYRASKAAMNAVMRSLAADLKPQGIAVVALHPGWVRTDMGGRHARLSVEESVAALRQVLERVTFADTGRFLRWDGREEPW
jgi:NAD(P)-dependent dehydrogenase (short-subunit alcohol dehydrogenase family)